MDKDGQKRAYPCLKLGDQSKTVVLFSEHKTGVVVAIGNDSSYAVGNHCNYWAEEMFIEIDNNSLARVIGELTINK